MPVLTLAETPSVLHQEHHRSTPAGGHRRLAFLLDNLGAGGVQRMTFAMARCCADRGHRVEILVCDPAGSLRDALPEGVALTVLPAQAHARTRWLAARADPLGLPQLVLPVLMARRPEGPLACLGGLADHLRSARPDALIAATPRLNLMAVWARRLAGVPTRLLLSERTTPSHDLGHGRKWRKRFLPPLMRRAYAQADAVVAVSNGVAEDLAALAGLPRGLIRTVYNPVVGPDLARLSREPVDHPWFEPGGPPVILSVGRLSGQKDFPTLIRAFARLRAERPARLLILGGGASETATAERIAALRALAADLGVADDLDLPGFAANPYAYMARARLFVLSSAWEGFGNALVEAMACGCPVVSTDCPSGPAEILDHGRYGPLVPVGDDAALAAAMENQLATPPPADVLQARAGEFTVRRATDAYLQALFGEDAPASSAPAAPLSPVRPGNFVASELRSGLSS